MLVAGQDVAASVDGASDLSCRIIMIYGEGDSLIYTGDGPSPLRKSVALDYYHSKIKFVFCSDSRDVFSHQVEYSTFLENYDSEWTPWSNLREVTYSNLRFGCYKFLVKARVPNSEVSEVDSYEFSIRPPFYLSLVAIIIYVLIVVGIVLVSVVVVKKRFREEKDILEQEISMQDSEFKLIKQKLEEQQKSLNSTLKDLAILSDSGQSIIKSITMKEISQTTFQELKKFFEVDDIGVGVYNAIHSSIDFPSFVLKGETMPFARYNLENMSNLIVWSFLNRKSLVINDYKNEVGNYIDTSHFKLDTTLFGSAVYTPLYDNDMTIGVFTVHSLKKNFFTPYHLSIIHNIATYLEFAIVNISYIKKNNYHKKQIEDRNEELQKTTINLKRSQKELQALNSELQKLQLAVMNSENSVVMLDANRNIIWVNNGFTKVYGYTFDDYVANGANYNVALKNPVLIPFFDEVYNTGKSSVFNLLHYTKEGKEIWVQSTITPILDANGNLDQVVVVDTDISLVKKAEAEIMKQRNEIAQKNKEVTKSIEYASVIQRALMTDSNNLKAVFKNSFFLNMPKDIVSGDFLWLGQKFGRKYVALCDCAGHGVPGAFVSMMGKMFLDEVLQSAKIEDTPGVLIRQLNDKLHDSVDSLSTKVGGIDGMDLSLIIINSRNTMLSYAGAYRPLNIIRDGELIKIAPDRCSVGNIEPGSDFVFRNHDIPLREGDFLLMSSDGYSDQFSQDNKRMGRNNFLNLVKKAAQLDTSQMADFFLDAHNAWKGSNEQMDDISIVGIVIRNDEDESIEYDE